MFDHSTFSVIDALNASADYKLYKSKLHWLYLFPADTDFSKMDETRPGISMEHKAVLIVNPNGIVTHNRFGRVS